MNEESGIRLFQRASMFWIIGFLLSGVRSAERLWLHPVSPEWLPPGPLRVITHALCGELPNGIIELSLVTIFLLALWQLIRGCHPFLMAVTWFLYVNLMNRAWMASSGGQQLMASLLFWSVPLAAKDGRLRFLGLWAIRLQLLIAYAATGLHKLTGHFWLEGTALGVAASDGAYGPSWIVGFPAAAHVLSWAVLLFQLTFPVAVWFSRTREPWMAFGLVFHLGTAIWMDIPEMGLAFVVAYAAWWGEGSREIHLPDLLRDPVQAQGGIGDMV